MVWYTLDKLAFRLIGIHVFRHWTDGFQVGFELGLLIWGLWIGCAMAMPATGPRRSARLVPVVAEPGADARNGGC